MDGEYIQLVTQLKQLDTQLGALLKQGDAWLKDQTVSFTDGALAGLQELNQARKSLLSEISEDDEALMLHLLEEHWPPEAA